MKPSFLYRTVGPIVSETKRSPSVAVVFLVILSWSSSASCAATVAWPPAPIAPSATSAGAATTGWTRPPSPRANGHDLPQGRRRVQLNQRHLLRAQQQPPSLLSPTSHVKMERSCRRTRIHPWTPSLVRQRLDDKGTRQADSTMPIGGGGHGRCCATAVGWRCVGGVGWILLEEPGSCAVATSC
jgi:hypothetical protein